MLAMVDLSTVLSATALLGGLVAAGVALIKAPRERNNISVTAAEGAVKVQVLLNEQMQEALNDVRVDVKRLRAELDIVRERLATVTAERDQLRRDNTQLRDRVLHLEQRVEDLSRHTGQS